MKLFEAKFPWIRDDALLVARVNPATLQQQLCMQIVDTKSRKILFEDSINCIHTAVSNIPVGDYEKVLNTKEFSHHVLDIESSEFLEEIQLNPKERFRALKSWVAGIAEAGPDACRIQADIEEYGHLVTPIANRLLRFAVRVDPTFLGDYLHSINRECRFDGKLHFASLRANVLPILDVIETYPKEIPRTMDLIEEICDIIEEEENSGVDPAQHADMWYRIGTAIRDIYPYKKAVYAYERSLRFFAEDYLVWSELGEVLAKLQEYSWAITAYNEALKLNHRQYENWHGLAVSCWRVGDYVGAMKACKRSLHLYSKHVPALVTLGLLRQAEGDLRGAISAWEKVLELDPLQVWTWLDLGTAYKEMGEDKKSRHYLRQGITLDPRLRGLKELEGSKLKPIKVKKCTHKRPCRDHVVRKDRQGIRARRTSALKRREYDRIVGLCAYGCPLRNTKDAKSNRHHDGTRRKEAYHAWGRNKRLTQTPTFLTVSMT